MKQEQEDIEEERMRKGEWEWKQNHLEFKELYPEGCLYYFSYLWKPSSDINNGPCLGL